MKVSAFLGVVVTSGASAVLLAGGCGSSNSGGSGLGPDSGLGGEAGYGVGGEAGYGAGGTGGSAGGPIGGPAPPADIKEKLDELALICITSDVNYVGDPVDSKLLGAARDKFAQGATDLPLSTSGCTRMFVDRDVTSVKSVWIVSPPYAVVTTTDPTQLSPYTGALSAWVPSATGESFYADMNADQFFEYRTTSAYEKQSVAEVHATAGGVQWRRTVTLTADQWFYDIKVERFDTGGAPEVTTTWAPVSQAVCEFPKDKPPVKDLNSKQPAKDSQTRDCSDAERESLMETLGTAASKGAECLSAMGRNAQGHEVLNIFTHKLQKIECTDVDQGFIAFNDRGFANLYNNKKFRLAFHTKMFKESPTHAESLGTAFHELLHFDGTHDANTEAALKDNDDARRLSDPTEACEYACFGTSPTECHIAACLGKKLSTSWKGKKCEGTLDPKILSDLSAVRGKLIPGCTTHQQIGAVCDDTFAEGKVQFCDTLLECNLYCNGDCKSKSVSCLADCR